MKIGMCGLFLSISIVALLLPLLVAYKNVTLTSLEGALSVTVFLPLEKSDLSNDVAAADIFYRSSRFDHSSMIGDIQRTTTEPISGTTRHHTLYGTDLWRVPHDPYWPESGVGLASEFGVGDDGDYCTYRCGWHEIDSVTNGVLGYGEARAGESFLKIGVGELVKGSCASCDSTGDYKFNSPYQFAKPSTWDIITAKSNSVIMKQEERLLTYGYRLSKEVVLDNNQLRVKTTLTNLGVQPLKTAWYSHHFFSCDTVPVGPGYSADLDLKQSIVGPLYDEPGMFSWSMPLRNYAKVQNSGDTIRVELDRRVEPVTRIKAEFLRDQETKGMFEIHGCGTTIVEDIAEFTEVPFDPISMYAYNLYIERGTLSPEPQILITLNPNESKTWTQRLLFRDHITSNTHSKVEEDLLIRSTTKFDIEKARMALGSTAEGVNHSEFGSHLCMLVLIVGVSILIGREWKLRRKRYMFYTTISEDS